MLTENKKAFIEFMMSADVLRFGSFVTKSGRSTPYFVNTGNYKTGEQIAKLGKFYAALVKETVGEDFTAMFGPAYKGIPLVTATAAALYNEYGISKPYFFNRKEEKDHGEGGSLVGYKPTDDDRIIIIEDVITAGTAVRETMPILYGCGDVRVDGERRAPNISHLTFARGGTAFLNALDLAGVACSGGAACSAHSALPSHVLMAMGRSEEEALRGVRFSFGMCTSEEEAREAAHIVAATYKKFVSA